MLKCTAPQDTLLSGSVAQWPSAESSSKFLSQRSMHNLIAQVFNDTFKEKYRTELVGGYAEPFYRAPDASAGARICYREDYASSALHEVSHWCVAGDARRKKDDFGYWYVPDGRDAVQQAEFESVEVKPQALEWLFSLAAGVRFQISADNLSAHNQGYSDFPVRVQNQALDYLEQGLPDRASRFLDALLVATGKNFPTKDQLDITKLR